MKSLLIFVSFLIIIYFVIFVFPNRVEDFALIPTKVHQGQIWRFFTYPFVHLTLTHLIENTIGLLLIMLLVIELKILFSDFSLTYLLSGFFAIIPLWILIPFVALGASSAIYGTFGLVSFKVRKIGIKTSYLILILVAAIFLKTFFSVLSCGINCENFIFSFKQGMAHFSGLAFGSSLFFLSNKLKILVDRRKIHSLRRLSE